MLKFKFLKIFTIAIDVAIATSTSNYTPEFVVDLKQTIVVTTIWILVTSYSTVIVTLSLNQA